MHKTGSIRVFATLSEAILIVGAFGALAVALWLYAYFGSDTLGAIPSDSMYTHADFDTF